MQYEVGALEFSYLFISLGRRREKRGGGGVLYCRSKCIIYLQKEHTFYSCGGSGLCWGPPPHTSAAERIVVTGYAFS